MRECRATADGGELRSIRALRDSCITSRSLASYRTNPPLRLSIASVSSMRAFDAFGTRSCARASACACDHVMSNMIPSQTILPSGARRGIDIVLSKRHSPSGRRIRTPPSAGVEGRGDFFHRVQ